MKSDEHSKKQPELSAPPEKSRMRLDKKERLAAALRENLMRRKVSSASAHDNVVCKVGCGDE